MGTVAPIRPSALREHNTQGQQIAATRSGLVVLNDDAKAAQATPLDPYLYLVNNSGNDGGGVPYNNVRDVATLGANYLETYVMHDTSVVAALVFRCFGLVPDVRNSQDASGNIVDAEVLPHHFSTSVWSKPVDADMGGSKNGGWFYPLADIANSAMRPPQAADPLGLTVEGFATLIKAANGGKAWRLSRGPTLFVGGCSRVITTVGTAATGPTTALIVGCFLQ